jgi:hypothetical protein
MKVSKIVASGLATLAIVAGTAVLETGVAHASESFPAKVDINGRAHIGDSATAAGYKNNAYLAGASVPIKCQAGYSGAIWDYTTDGWWVPDTYVKTGTDGFVSSLPKCAEDDGSVGGTSSAKVNAAIAYAKARIGHTDWDGQCELFVEKAYGTSGRYATATADYQAQHNAGRMHAGTVPPAGALLFFTSTTASGHVMLSLGNNTAISTGPSVYETSTFRDRSDYLGWSYAPTSW